jgi:hypothetical protein
MKLTDRLKEKLIELFSRHSTDEIKEKSGELLKEAIGEDKYRKITQARGYNEFYVILKELREKLERELDIDEGIQQVKNCLRLLHEQRKESRKDFQLLEKLTREGIYMSIWNQDQKDYFDFGIEMIDRWKDYFLSYTNRNKHETNSDFRKIIRSVFGSTFFNDNKEKLNCVAPLIVKYLKEDGLEGFFDKHDIDYGNEWEDKIIKNCRAVYTFVQLVEKPIFIHKEDGRNWCHKEFKTFTRWIEETERERGLSTHNRHFFILMYTKGEISPANLHHDHRKWKSKITKTQYINDLVAMDKRKIRFEIGEFAKLIIITRDQMLTDYCE